MTCEELKKRTGIHITTKSIISDLILQTINFNVRLWFSGMTVASQAMNPGSNPGSRMRFCLCLSWVKNVMPEYAHYPSISQIYLNKQISN